MRCRRSAFLRAPTRSSTARSCSRPEIPPPSGTNGFLPAWGCARRLLTTSPPVKRGEAEIRAALAQLERQALRRERRTIEGFPVRDSRVAIVSNGRPLIDFSSNDYLGLARHPEVVAALQQCADSQGVGSGASHLVTGHGREHARLEDALADFTGRQRALLFSTGYMANLAVLTTLAGRADTVLLDRLCHASLIDAARLSGARFKRYAHADVAAAGRALADMPSTCVIATDGLFSMDGEDR